VISPGSAYRDLEHRVRPVRVGVSPDPRDFLECGVGGNAISHRRVRGAPGVPRHSGRMVQIRVWHGERAASSSSMSKTRIVLSLCIAYVIGEMA
jgi:hypothetical protein